ncbi:hypothetical protein E1292_21135 [Nonomuraea deserti]|uniref:Chitin-binding type-3 domain-containing protein n=1 Tax=Nonomuraea deserti TaxID=1848322 RepID=A0A4R4VME3_9ACTN|nr:hypothetical protein [Nonomuraea deserti]TDD03355.1 hypothetical protein E1292_21135 [Nonomuraea deserti]
MITETSRMAVMLTATVVAGGAALAAAPAAGATTSTGYTYCTYKALRATEKWTNPGGDVSKGTWK